MAPVPTWAERFAADLDRLAKPATRLGVAVSGGPDSLALLLLAAAARPGMVQAATVDHGLRASSGAEADLVADICSSLSVPHATLRIDWEDAPEANVQARAREGRYAALGLWASESRLNAVATAHHLDDQAETLLMRIARGAGVGGLAGIRESRPLGTEGVQLIRPLLGWRRSQLREIVDEANLIPVDDATNRDERFDRNRIRRWIAETPWLSAERLAAAATNSREAAEALEWAAAREFKSRCSGIDDALLIDAAGLPPEFQRRLLLIAFEQFGTSAPPGPQVSDALATLNRGGTTTLAGLKFDGGRTWRIAPAPPRRR